MISPILNVLLRAVFGLRATVPPPELPLDQFALCPFLQPCRVAAFLQGHSCLHMAVFNPTGIQVGTLQKNRGGLWVVTEAVPCAKTCGAALMPVSS